MTTTAEREVTTLLKEDFDKEYLNCFRTAVDLWKSRAPAYDTELPVWHRMPFGEISFIHEIAKKAGRLVALARAPDMVYDFVDEELLDVINYCAALYAYRRLGSVAPEPELVGEEKPGDFYP